MINHIEIKNFAVIENTAVDFHEGLNIITGETGAGKSIAVEAISLALGSRADTSAVRTGCQKAIVQLLGTLNDEEIIITREVSTSGKSICKLNGELVTLSQLNNTAMKLADIHGQYDNQYLLNPDAHISFLDSYHQEEMQPLKQALLSSYENYTSIKSDLAHLISIERESARKKDFYAFEIDEIDKANLKANEDRDLFEEISVLQNSEKIYENLQKAYQTLSDDSPSVLDGIGTSLRELGEISQYSKEISDLSAELEDLFYRMQDICSCLRESKESIIFSPTDLDKAISRQYLIDNLKKKYGNSIEEILEYRDKICKELASIENFQEEKKKLEIQLMNAKKDLIDKCSVLSSKRRHVAKELESGITQQLKDLNFSYPKLSICVSPLQNPTENGMDKVEILISTNKGEPLKPLYKVASGGEMSRIMLAFKTIISAYDNIPTLIFDEIDNGISGITASIVGQKLKSIARSRQIICITHLAQIAACGDYNYRIHKETKGEGTFTSIDSLSRDETVSEIARLIGGANITPTTMESARELLLSSL